MGLIVLKISLPLFKECVFGPVYVYAVINDPAFHARTRLFLFFLEMLFNDMKFPAIPKRNIMFPVKFLLKIPSWKRHKSVKHKATFSHSCVISVCQSLLLCYVSCAMKQQSIINSTVCAICLLNQVLKQQTTCANVSTWVLDELNR